MVIICYRYTKPQTFADCIGNELPLGWEEAYDPQIGRYYINHVNRKYYYLSNNYLIKHLFLFFLLLIFKFHWSHVFFVHSPMTCLYFDPYFSYHVCYSLFICALTILLIYLHTYYSLLVEKVFLQPVIYCRCNGS